MPLGVNLARAVASMESEYPSIFGNLGAYAQVFSLLTSASAAGLLAGPAWTRFAFWGRKWTFLVSILGLLCASVVRPLVRCLREVQQRMIILELTKMILDVVLRLEKKQTVIIRIWFRSKEGYVPILKSKWCVSRTSQISTQKVADRLGNQERWKKIMV